MSKKASKAPGKAPSKSSPLPLSLPFPLPLPAAKPLASVPTRLRRKPPGAPGVNRAAVARKRALADINEGGNWPGAADKTITGAPESAEPLHLYELTQDLQRIAPHWQDALEANPATVMSRIVESMGEGQVALEASDYLGLLAYLHAETRQARHRSKRSYTRDREAEILGEYGSGDRYRVYNAQLQDCLAARKGAAVEASGLAQELQLKTKGLHEQAARALAAEQAAQSESGAAINLFEGYRPHAKQVQAHKSGARWLCVVAGRRGGKTYMGAREFLRRVFADLARMNAQGRTWAHPEGAPIRTETPPLLLYWCVAPIYSLTVLARREIQAILGRFPKIVLKWTDSGGLWLAGGILVEFKTAENNEMLVGSGLHGAWVDEAARVKARAWRDSIRPALSEHQGWALFTTTPLGRNWVYTDFWEPAIRGRAGFGAHTWHTADNTAFPALVAEVEEARQTLPRAIFERNYRASWDAFEGQIFEEFDADLHVIDAAKVPNPLSADEIIAGQDWGFSAPGALVVVARFGERWIAVAELYEPRLSVVAQNPGDRSWIGEAKRLRETWQFAPAYCDTENAEAVDAYQRAGLPAVGAVKHVGPGLETVAAYLHPVSAGSLTRPDERKARLLISSACPNLIRELPGYTYQQRNDAPTERPADGQSDHAVDALRYAMHSHEVMRGGHAALARVRKWG